MKKEDFVVGLWYKSKDWANKNDFCKGLEFDGDRVTFKEVITGGYYKNDKLNGWYTHNGDLEIASKTEYSKYLPEGHSDKIGTVIVGAWYKNKKWVESNSYCKAVKIDLESGSLFFSEKIKCREYSKGAGSWGLPEYIELASPEEYSIFLPQGHPDKIKEIVKGAWYRNKFWGEFSNFGKVDRYSDTNAIFVTEKIINGKYEKQVGNWHSASTMELANPDDYSGFLPTGRPDKLSDRYSNYKVGDYILVSNRRNEIKQTMLIKQITLTSFMGPTLEKGGWNYFHPDEVIRLTDDINIRKAFQDEIDELNDKIGGIKKGLITEFKKDEYYLITYLRTGDNYLTKWNGTNQSGPRIEIETKYYAIGGNWGNMSSDTHRISYATQEQINWLDACIKADKYVPLEEAVKYKLTCLPKGEYFHITTKFSKQIVMGTGSAQCGDYISYEFTPASRPFYADGKTAKWINDDDDDVDIRKATPDEIQWLNACIKAERFIEKANIPKILPKVGDWVITADFSPHYDGKPLRINRIKDGRYCFFDNSRDDSHNFGFNHIVRFCRADELLQKCSTPTATLVDTSLIPSCKKSTPDLYRVYTTPTVKDPKVFTEPISLSILGTKLIPVKLIPERKKPELPKIVKINLLNTKKVVSLHP